MKSNSKAPNPQYLYFVASIIYIHKVSSVKQFFSKPFQEFGMPLNLFEMGYCIL